MNQIDLSRTPRTPRAHCARSLFQPHAVAMAAAALCGWHGLTWAQNVPSTTLPTGGVVARGTATISTNGSNATPVMNIDQTSSRAVINWGTFSVGSNATVAHQTPGATAITLHRVVGEGNGPSRSFIDGSITSNGKVFLVNTAGVVFGSTARVNVGALVASSRDLDPSLQANNFDGFVNGQQLTLNSNSSGNDEVVAVNDGAQITAGPNGSILLIAGNQTNVVDSTLTANGGNVGLVAATDTVVDVGQSGFVRLVSTSTSSSGSGSSTPIRRVTVANGQIDAVNGSVQLLARGANSEVPTVTLNTSTVRANGQGGGRGSVELIASGGIGSVAQISSSTVDVSALDAASTAGSVNMLARSVTANSGGLRSTIRADGPSGGGSITLGDLCADLCTTERASSVLVGSTTVLSADATANGNGGSITLSSTFSNAVAEPVAYTDFGVVALYGVLRARGGTTGGNGGLIQTVGPSLTASLRSSSAGPPLPPSTEINASARAANAVAGLWLIRSGDATLSNSDPLAGDTGVFSPATPGAQGITRTMNSALVNGTHVTVNTDFAPSGGARIGTGNITVTSDAAIAGSANTTLRLEAANNITVQAGSTISRTPSAAGAFNVVMLGDVDGRNGSVGQPGGVVQGAVNVSLPGGSFTASGHSVAGQSPVDGVNLSGTISADNITLTGSSQQRYGVNVGGLNLRPTEGVAGNVVIRGTALRSASSVPSSVQLAGVNFEEGIDLLAGLASVTIAGRGDDGGFSADTGLGAVGVRLNDLAITGDAASSGRITLAGQSVNSPGSGILAVGTGNTLEIRSNSDGNAPLGASIVIGASSDAQASRALDFNSGLRPRIITTGGVNLRPLGVDVAGNVVEATNTVIHVGANAPASTNFVLDSRLLNNVTATEGGIRATQGVVIGSNEHTGQITVGNQGFDVNSSPVTLQNQGVGSGGIRLNGNVGGRGSQLSLISAGDIIQEGGSRLFAQSLVVVGSPTSVVSLTRFGVNEISSLSFDGLRTIDVWSDGPLTVTGGSFNSFSLADGFAQRSLTANRAGERVNLRIDFGDIRISGTSLSLSEANATLSLASVDSSVILSSSSIEAGAGPLNVSISALGPVVLTSDERTSTITTNGGNVSMEGRGVGFSSILNIVRADRTVIDTRGASSAGDISILGFSGSSQARGVLLTNSLLTGRDITIRYDNSSLLGVDMAQTTMNASGNVLLSGRSTNLSSTGGSGVRISDNSQINLSNTSELRIAGVGTLNGAVLDDLTVRGGFRIVLAGQHTSSAFSGAGLRNSAGTPGVRIGAAVGAADGGRSGAEVLIAASSGDTSPAIDMDGGLRIQTLGRVNIRPADAGLNGDLLDSFATTIRVGGSSSSSSASNFAVPLPWLNPVTGIDALGVVIGSQQHTGAITVADGALANAGAMPITLQNQGVGSGGIRLNGNLGGQGLQLSLISASDIIQEDTGVLTAQSLIVSSSPTSVVSLNSQNNAISLLSFDGARTIDAFSSGNFQIDSGSFSSFGSFSTVDGFSLQIVGTNRVGERLTLGSGGSLSVVGAFAFSQADATLSLSGRDQVSLSSFSIDAGAGPLDVNIASVADTNGIGRVVMSGGSGGERTSRISTNGGNVVIRSGADRSTGTALGVVVGGTTIDTRGASGTGDITIRSVTDTASEGTGVQFENSALTGRNVSVNPLDSLAQALDMDATSITASGNVRLSGSDTSVSSAGIGVRMVNGSRINLSNTSELLIAGVGTLNGALLDDLTVLGGSRIVLAGQRRSSATLGAGLRSSAETPGVRIGAADGGRSAADVLIAASSNDNAPAIDMDGGLRIQTTGRVNIRPANVSVNGDVLDSHAATIRVGGSSSSSTATTFAVPIAWLSPVAGIDAAQLVIGSQQHTGTISVAAGALANTGALPVTLQNQGIGSGGIAFEGAAGSASLNLGLSTAGNISQAGGLTAARLVVQGGPQSTVNLNATGNRVARVSFDPPAALSLVTSGNLAVDGGQAQGFDATTATFTGTAITTNEAGQSLLLQSLDGDLALNSSIRMLGTNATVNLVAGNRFATLPSSRINFGEGGGAWRVWMNSATGNTTEGLVGSNLYGCSFGDSATCSGSGAAISPTSNMFLYTQRPTLQVTSNPQRIQQGAALPALTYAVTGLVNGDTQATALAGALDTAATNSNTAGSFAIRQGTLNSPSGYQINYNNGNQTPVNLVVQVPQSLVEGLAVSLLGGDNLFTEQRTDVYGSNRPARPNVCAAVSTIRSASGQDLDLEPLTAEWLRVRGQPQLSGCLQINNERACSVF